MQLTSAFDPKRTLARQVFRLDFCVAIENTRGNQMDRPDQRGHNTRAVSFAVAVEPRAVARRICLTAQQVFGTDATLHGPISVGRSGPFAVG